MGALDQGRTKKRGRRDGCERESRNGANNRKSVGHISDIVRTVSDGHKHLSDSSNGTDVL